MEQFIANSLVGQDIEFFCLGGSKYSGTVKTVENGVVILEWDNKTSYLACDKIVAAWPKEQAQRPTPNIGFAR